MAKRGRKPKAENQLNVKSDIKTESKIKKKRMSKIKINSNRQFSSLDNLTRQFINCIKNKENEVVDINKLVETLGVKKRRIYDITNVLEGN